MWIFFSYKFPIIKSITIRRRRKISISFIRKFQLYTYCIKDIIQSYEQQLKDDPNAVLTSGSEGFEWLNQYLNTSDEPSLSERFRNVCETSLHRVHQQSKAAVASVNHRMKEEEEMLDAYSLGSKDTFFKPESEHDLDETHDRRNKKDSKAGG